MRGLKVLVVVMGVLIVLGTTALVVAVITRGPGRARAVAGTAAAAGPVAEQAVLGEPAGTHVAALSLSEGRLALSLQGGGPDRVVLLDLASGRVLGRVSLAR